jgi:cation transport regulator ChaC
MTKISLNNIKLMPYVFGYGSLIWKADFPYISKEFGYITGYVRRFWQGSNDHRGTVEKVGRVVTLVPVTVWREKFEQFDPHGLTDKIYGAVYEISAEEEERVFKHLDHREKNGYDCHEIDIYLVDGRILKSKVYIASHQDPSFLGPGGLKENTIDIIAEQIVSSAGASGQNRDYLFKLVHAMEVHGFQQDDHLLDLTAKVRFLINKPNT